MKILLATDGSAGALKAAERMRGILRADDIVVVCSVVRTPSSLEEAGEALAGESDAVAAASLRAVEEVLGSAPGRVETRILFGDPVRAICRVAGEEAVDLIVVGHRGRGDLAALVLGSVSIGVVQHAPVSVLVVR